MSTPRPSTKVRADHLARKAIVYVRQSSLTQVRENLESQRLQYALAERAHTLGWKKVETVDIDLGRSAGFGARERPGFEKVITMVALGEVGIVLSREASRLSRTDRDWCRLLEVCQVFSTLIADDDQIYDLDQMDDQLVLGIKGTLSVVELKVLKMRLEAGRQARARRGEYKRRIPSGYVYDPDGRPVKDPDLRVRDAIALVFTKFREIGCVRQLHRWLVDEGIEFPVRRTMMGKMKLAWHLPTLLWVAHVLKNPFYAGAYVYGQRPLEMTVVEGRVVKKRGPPRPVEESSVFIPDHHEAYIDWDTFRENRRMIADNRARTKGTESRTAPGKGTAVLVGLLRCGHCGRKIQVHYPGTPGTTTPLQYICRGDQDASGDYCMGFRGARVERAVVAEVLRVVSPLGVDASLLAIERVRQAGSERVAALTRRIEQLEYEATRAHEQYDEVDPRNRLVASELERRWNAKLEEVARARTELAKHVDARREIDADAVERIRALGATFEAVWNDARCTPEMKKRIVRTVLEEVVVTRVDREVTLVLHWAGGVHTRLSLHQPTRGDHQRTSGDALDIIRKLAPYYDDTRIAAVLGREGLRTGTGKRWTKVRVSVTRRRYSIDGGVARPSPEVLTLKGAMQEYGITNYVIDRLVAAGLVRNDQAVPSAPHRLSREDLESPRVKKVLAELARTGRLVVHGDVTKNQRNLFEENREDDNEGSRG